MNQNLAGRVALVTGAGVGIGRAGALAMGRAGAFVGVHYNRSENEALATLQAIREAGGDGMVLQAELSREDEVNRIVDDLAAQAGRLDVVVNNAGTVVQRARIEECTLEVWQRSMDINMTSAFLVTRRAIPHLRAGGKGSIINIISLSTQTGGANGAGAYAAAKGALQIFTRTLARELAPEVRANAICPGVIETRHHEQHTTHQRMEEYRQETPLKRNGMPAEVGEAILFLAGDTSSFITGALLDINGGRFLR